MLASLALLILRSRRLLSITLVALVLHPVIKLVVGVLLVVDTLTHFMAVLTVEWYANRRAVLWKIVQQTMLLWIVAHAWFIVLRRRHLRLINATQLYRLDIVDGLELQDRGHLLWRHLLHDCLQAQLLRRHLVGYLLLLPLFMHIAALLRDQLRLLFYAH